MAVQYKTGICLLFLLISSPVPSACVTILACTSPATTISLTQVSETFKYPSTGSYPLLTTCEWLFQSSDTSNTISFVVSNIYVDCGDILRFHDGTSSSASAIGNAICCSGCTHAYKSTTGNNLYGKLSTDNTLSASESGFQVTINVGKDESSCPTSPTVNPSVSLSSSITLTSPRFPKAYPSNFECTYTYTYSSGTIQIEFLYLDVEPNGSDCYDFVEIYDGSSTSSSVIKRVCGTTLPAKYTSTGSSMTLKFSSDAYSTNLGYKAIISPVGTEESTTTASTVSSTVEDSTTTATTEGSTSEGNPSSSSNVGEIVGATIGSSLGLGVIASIIFVLKKYTKIKFPKLGRRKTTQISGDKNEKEVENYPENLEIHTHTSPPRSTSLL